VNQHQEGSFEELRSITVAVVDWRNRSGTHISFGHRGWRGVLTQVLTGSRRVVAPVQGYGTAYYTSGHKYTGEFFEGMMQGNGTYTWLDGIRYVMNSCTRFRSSAISGLLSFEGPSAGPNTGTDTRARVGQPLWPRACHRRRFPVHISLCGSQLCSIRHRLHTHSSTLPRVVGREPKCSHNTECGGSASACVLRE
jgi:hypothetical protein